MRQNFSWPRAILLLAALAGLALLLWTMHTIYYDPERLIERLASPNKPPVIPHDSERLEVFPFPDDYDQPAQRRVWNAMGALRKCGTAAFPAMIAHLDDQRYSLTDETAVFENSTVGDVCFRIIASQVNVHPGYLGCANYIEDKIDRKHLPDWWRERSAWTIEQLHREALEWTIAEEERRARESDSDHERERAATRVSQLRVYMAENRFERAE